MPADLMITGLEVPEPEEPSALGSFLVDGLNFDSDLAKLVDYGDKSMSVVDSGKFIYADQDDGVLLASSFDEDKWEEAEFRKTDDEIYYRLRKKK